MNNVTSVQVQRVDDPQNVECHQLTAVHRLCRGGKADASQGDGSGGDSGDKHYADAARALGDLIAALDVAEPHNHRAYYKSAQFASRMAGRNPLVLQQALTLIERAIKLDANTADYLVELAFQKSLVGDTKVAKKTYDVVPVV